MTGHDQPKRPVTVLRNPQIFGQFVSQCEGDNVPGPNPANTSGPQIIQLYKTYIDNNQTPSTDS
ncbi:hypothetical protein SAMN05216178_1325 [Pseudomonas saponiphila]|uniref:Uncharacterized protein n=1 Tax=Pseudomonas saponiphila TaxID=556534 RepID=A0A1H4KIH7_9PSED|nr:hypothetical protein SAMN05216178_1325 [Pseudomonas saponiphila]